MKCVLLPIVLLFAACAVDPHSGVRSSPPADKRLLTLPDGTSIVAVPEQARNEPQVWAQRVRIIRHPKEF